MFKKIEKRGQGILEVMTAIYIFIVALVSIMSLVVFNIQINDLNADFLVASNLAREGIEAVRIIRDSNWESGHYFADDLRYASKSRYLDDATVSNNRTQATFLLKNNYLSGGYGYEINTIGISWANCISPTYTYHNSLDISTNELCKLYLISPSSDDSKKQYDYGIYNYPNASKTETQFYRILYINQICASGYGEKILVDVDLDNPLGVNKSCSAMLGDPELIGLQVVARVGWMSSHGFKEVKIEERLYNWQTDKNIGQELLMD